MQAIIRPSRVRIYINSARKSIDQVQAETGCRYILNGGVFNWDWTAGCWLKAEGRLLASEAWKAWGFGWNSGPDIRMQLDDRGKENFINCVALVKDGKALSGGDLIYPADMGGARQRTAWCLMGDGRHLLWCSAGAMTPEALRDRLLSLGARDAIMLDGGSSSQCRFPDGRVNGGRAVQNLLCFWTDEEEKGEDDMKYDPPARNLSLGSQGEDVKWLQDKLNGTMHAGLDVDGVFGSATERALRRFQDAVDIQVDGIAGKDSRHRLGLLEGLQNSSDPLIAKAAGYVGTMEPSGDDSIIAAYNKLAGTSFGSTTAWCQIFVTVCQAEAGLQPLLYTASCTAARNAYRTAGQWADSGEIGNLIYFDWDGSGDCDHVGVLCAREGDTLYTIEGNAAGSGADGVRLKSYDKDYRRIAGFARLSPKAQAPDADAQPEGDNVPADWAREAVEWAQEQGLLKGDQYGNLQLHKEMTREEMCVFLYRFKEL